MTPQATTAAFPEAFAELRARAGLTFRQLAERTRAADPSGKGLSDGHLVRLAKGDAPLVADALRLIAAAFADEIAGPEYFVEYRMAQLRRAFDPRQSDPQQALRSFLAWEALPARERVRILTA